MAKVEPGGYGQKVTRRGCALAPVSLCVNLLTDCNDHGTGAVLDERWQTNLKKFLSLLPVAVLRLRFVDNPDAPTTCVWLV